MSKTKKIEKEPGMNVTHVLLGIILLAFTLYCGWIIVQAPDATGMDLAAYSSLLQEKMGFLGGLLYLLMHGLMGKGIVLFPFLFCLSGLCLLSGRQLSQMQVAGGVMAGLVVLATLHMNITYVDVKDDLLLGLNGNGGGVIGAALSLVLQKALGNVGAYIVLFCIAIIAVVLIAQGAVFGRGEDFLAAVRQSMTRVKETLLDFIFIEEEEEDFAQEPVIPEQKKKTKAPAKADTPAKAKASAKEEAPRKAAPVQPEPAMAEPAASKKRTKLGRLKSFFVEEESPAPAEQQRPRYSGAEYVVIPKEKPVILNSLVEIHKALDEQEPRTGLSPREPLVEQPYLIADSVEDFHQLLEKRQVKQSEQAAGTADAGPAKKTRKQEKADQQAAAQPPQQA
ncbi:MAG: DNA translocase FtsK 4TM domain-containing protein, partial [Peptococcaceae bacterium]